MKNIGTIVECYNCKKEFQKNNYEVKRSEQRNQRHFCSIKCSNKYDRKFQTKCGWCDKQISVVPSILKKSKSGKAFCCQSHSASYNNSIREQNRRSKIEIKFYELLVKEFPNLIILPNDKTMLEKFEVDIAIPSLKLAIEWNGIVHFKPIYGKNKLKIVQNRDNLKRIIATKKDINLIVIPDLVSNDEILKRAFEDVSKIIKELLLNIAE
jgi:hypothetical protein